MKIRTRLIAAFCVLVTLGFYLYVDWILDDLRLRYQATMEEAMVDTATILSSLVAQQVKEGAVQTADLRQALGQAQRRVLSAQIFEMTKTDINMRVYVTDRNGVVLFDSDGGKAEGMDYSRWNDVTRTLHGQYGARATRADPDDPMSAMLYVASPIEVDGQTVGVLSVGKPAMSMSLFIHSARRETAVAAVIAAVAVVLLGVTVSVWVTWPIEKLTHYARRVRDGKRERMPRLGKGDIGDLGTAFEEMRTALEGKQYVEDYVQTLTHQMKSPISAIRGTAELLEEDMPPEQRARFLENLRSESDRIQNLVDRMLDLSSIENRNELREVESIDLRQLVSGVIESLDPVFSDKRVRVLLGDSESVTVNGERFLLAQALSNLLQNAVDFSPEGRTVTVTIAPQDGHVEVVVLDEGPGVPDYALDKVFDRFYSLVRPDTGKKSSGLGLTFVKEVAELHKGSATIENRPEGGAKAVLSIPLTV